MEGESHTELGPLTGNNVLTIAQGWKQTGLFKNLDFKSLGC